MGIFFSVWGSVKSPATAGHNTDFCCCCCCCCCVEDFFIQILSFRAWMLKVECKDQNLTTPHWLSFSTPQWTSTRHLSSNPTSFDSHASGCYPWWGDSNTSRRFQRFCWSPAAMWLLWVWLWVSHVQPRCPNTRSPSAGLPLSSWGCWRMMTSLFFLWCSVIYLHLQPSYSHVHASR